MSLHSKIMAIAPEQLVVKDPLAIDFYEAGHQRARHVAAELAAEHEAMVERMAEALTRLREHVQGDIETENDCEAEYVQDARDLVAATDVLLAEYREET